MLSLPEISINCDRHHGMIRPGSHVSTMDGDSLTSKNLCPSCGRRSIAATSGYSELHTYGCRECGVLGHGRKSPERSAQRHFRVLYAGSNVEKARELFADAIRHRPRIRLTIWQRARVLQQWP
jgi:predicted RNA-binding Zn-ribbon protein involved in translation (DUF1610 family)